MPKLGNTSKRVMLPSSTDDDPAWIELKTALFPLDVLDLKEQNEDEYTLFCNVASRAITSWNFTDLDGNPIEPTPEWIDKLPNEDKKFVITTVGELIGKSFEGLSNDEKKTLSAPSIATEQTEVQSPPII